MKLYVIHRADAHHRLADLATRLKGFEYELVKPNEPLDGQLSLTRTHLDLIAFAENENLPFIVVCEDDVLPTAHFHTIFERIKEADLLGADVYLAGCCLYINGDKITETGMYQNGAFDGTQCTVYFNRMYKKRDKIKAGAISQVLRAARLNILTSYPLLSGQKRYPDSMCTSHINYGFNDEQFLKYNK